MTAHTMLNVLFSARTEFFFLGQKLSNKDAFSNSGKSRPEAFKKHVGRLSLELCLPYIGLCISFGIIKFSWNYTNLHVFIYSRLKKTPFLGCNLVER